MEPSIFPFLSAMFGVLVALGIARLIQALGAFATSRQPVRVYWIHGGWIVFMLVVYLHLWWSLWDLRTIETWHYFGFLYLLLGPATLYMATSLIVPSQEREVDFDSRGYYLRIRR